MKKSACLFAAAVLLAGCGGGSGSAEKTGEVSSQPNDKGQVTTVKVTTKDDKITKIEINDTYEKDGKATTKKELKDGYNMKSASSIGKEWWEQIAFLEDFIAKNGLEKVGTLNDEGKPTNADVLSGCTMAIDSYVKTAEEAVKAAK